MTGRPNVAISPESLGNELAQPTYLTAVQVGKLVQLSAKSIYRVAKDDPTMPMLKIGGTVRFPRERLLA